MPAVVNRHRYLPTPGVGPHAERTGRERRPELPQPWIYVGRGTPLGNPYKREQHGDDAIELYRRHLAERIKAGDPAVLRQLDSITEDTSIVCSCAPKPCHADVVLRAWLWRRTVERAAAFVIVSSVGDRLTEEIDNLDEARELRDRMRWNGPRQLLIADARTGVVVE